MAYHKFSGAEKQFLIDNIGKCVSYRNLADMFNETFGTTLSTHSISDICIKRLKIHRNANTGKFGEREERPATKPIGTEVTRDDGYIWVKYADNYHKGKTDYNQLKENWCPKHRYIYEQQNGVIPDGNIVVFLDGDKRNFDIKNLYCINRKINAMMCVNKWFTHNRENTLTAIKYCELFYILKDVTI